MEEAAEQRVGDLGPVAAHVAALVRVEVEVVQPQRGVALPRPAARPARSSALEGFAKAHAAFTACSARFNRHSSENARAYLSIAC